MTPKKVYYMHTIDGQPATWSDDDGQIVYADDLPRWQDRPLHAELCTSVHQIRRDQKRSILNRAAWGMSTGAGKYGWVLVDLPTGKPHNGRIFADPLRKLPAKRKKVQP